MDKRLEDLAGHWHWRSHVALVDHHLLMMSEAYLHGDNHLVHLAAVDRNLERADHRDNRLEVGMMVGFVVDSQDNDCVVVDNCRDIAVVEVDLVGDWGPVVVALDPAVGQLEHLVVVDSFQHLTQLVVVDCLIEV